MSENQEIPSGWASVKLSELVVDPKKDLVDGPFGSNLKAYEYTDSGVPVFKIQNIKANQFIDKQINYVTEEKAKSLERHSFASGDLIITKLGNPLGLCCKVPEKYKYGVIVADLMRLRPNKSVVYDQFLIYAINCNVVQNQFKEITKGTTRPRVNLTIVREIELALPPLPEQHRIVAKIEELFSSLDKGIESLKTAQQQLKIYRQAVLKWAFEGKLTNKNIKEDELPEGWQKVNLGEISEKIQIGPFGTQLHKEDYVIGGIPLINPMHFKDGIIESDSSYSISTKKRDSLPNYILSEGDIIIGRRGEMGRCGLVGKKEAGWFCGTGSLYIRPKSKVANSFFLLHCLKGRVVKKYLEENAAGTTMANLNLKIVNNIPICMPPIDEQHAIVAEIESRLSVCDKIEESIEQSLKQAESLRQSILKKAFAGKLVPQDPNDEPASKLLERIKMEKEKTVSKKRSFK